MLAGRVLDGSITSFLLSLLPDIVAMNTNLYSRVQYYAAHRCSILEWPTGVVEMMPALISTKILLHKSAQGSSLAYHPEAHCKSARMCFGRANAGSTSFAVMSTSSNLFISANPANPKKVWNTSPTLSGRSPMPPLGSWQ